MLHVSTIVLTVFTIYMLSARTVVTCIYIADTMLKINVCNIRNFFHFYWKCISMLREVNFFLNLLQKYPVIQNSRDF